MAFEARIEDAARSMAVDLRFKGLSPAARNARIEFVVGNLIFVATHEMGHAVIAEMSIPVLGREEDAADDYAILAALKVVATDFSVRLLERAAESWFLMARRDKDVGDMPEYYDRHGLDQQRAYQIVCLMVGSDPVRFKGLADKTKLPEDRRRSCGWDFGSVSRSWGVAMEPYLRKPDDPKTEISVTYGEAKGDLTFVARSFRNIEFLETFADFFSERYRWPAPIALEMKSCGESNASWIKQPRRMVICYELAEEFAQLYAKYGSMMSKRRMRR